MGDPSGVIYSDATLPQVALWRSLPGVIYFGSIRVLSCELFQAGWDRTSARYRQILYEHGQEKTGDGETREGKRCGFSREKVEAVLAKGGKVSRAEILRCRVRYFCDGAVFGTTEFVNGVFDSNRTRYGPKRKSGARKMRGLIGGSCESCVIFAKK